jgi:hypothetical protein
MDKDDMCILKKYVISNPYRHSRLPEYVPQYLVSIPYSLEGTSRHSILAGRGSAGAGPVGFFLCD